MTVTDPQSPDTLADDLIVGAADLAHFIFGSHERRFQRRVYYLCTVAKRPLPHFRLGSQIAARRSTIIRWIAAQEYGR